MKKTKLMLGVAALSAALLGTGYAAMTDVLTIDGTVNTANFDVDFVGGITPVGDAAQNPDKYEIKALNAQTGNEDDKVSLQAENLKPGVPVTYETTMQNMSSIDAQLKSIELSSAEVSMDALKANTEVTVVLNDDESKTFKWTLAEMGSKDVTDMILQENNNNVDAAKSVNVKVTVNVKPDAFNGTTETTSQKIDFTLQFNWEQTSAEN